MADTVKGIGFYGGTFDPIHHGHIHLALTLMEKNGLKEVLFCPTPVNPLKQKGSSQAPFFHRMKMVELAISDILKFRIIDLEAKRSEPYYTFDTLQTLKEMYKEPIHLLLGSDTLTEFTKWHRYQDIIKNFPIIVGTRNKGHLFESEDPLLNKKVAQAITIIPCLEISATEVRRRLKDRLYCKHLVPPKVIDYIYSNQLYF